MGEMTRRERLTATLAGRPVDRPAFSFYEIGGLAMDADDPDPFNIHGDPSWRPLLELAERETDLIRMCYPGKKPAEGNCREEFFKERTYEEGGSRFVRTALTVGGRTLTSLERRDRDVDTIWHVEHLLKDTDDVEAYLQLPDEVLDYEPDAAPMKQAEEALGDRGIVMVDTADPLCAAASLFDMETYLIIAMTERTLFHKLLDKLARPALEFTWKLSSAFGGHLWRICGPEYAGEPYLPPALFDEYVVRYAAPMVHAIQAHGGYARIHMHGRIRSALPLLAKMRPDGLDPIEPPPLGDVQLAEVRRDYGRDMVLFGNLETRDIDGMPPEQFEKVVAKALCEGTGGEGRGFVLMPSACPVGRRISAATMQNYRTIARMAAAFRG